MNKHPKKIITFSLLGTLLPLTPAFADDDAAAVASGPHDPSFYPALLKLLGLVLGPAATMLVGGILAGSGAAAIAFGKTMIGFGRKKLEDNDTRNDFVGEFETAAGNAVVAFGEKLSPPEKTQLALAPAPSDSNSTPKTGT